MNIRLCSPVILEISGIVSTMAVRQVYCGWFRKKFLYKSMKSLQVFHVLAQRRKRGPLGILGVGAPVDCYHCLTEILYLY